MGAEGLLSNATPMPDPVEVWWMDTAKDDLDRTLPKAIEYGSVDLEIIGDMLRRLLDWNDAPDRVGVELGISFYLAGKVARMMGAYADKRLPSDDTLLDIVVYGMMLRRTRENGRWPN